MGGPQWDYIETVLIPWLQAQVEAQQETDRQKWLQREREAREKLNNDIAAWAAARGPFSVSPPLPSTLDAEWDDIRAVHRRPSS